MWTSFLWNNIKFITLAIFLWGLMWIMSYGAFVEVQFNERGVALEEKITIFNLTLYAIVAIVALIRYWVAFAGGQGEMKKPSNTKTILLIIVFVHLLAMVLIGSIQ